MPNSTDMRNALQEDAASREVSRAARHALSPGYAGLTGPDLHCRAAVYGRRLHLQKESDGDESSPCNK